VLGFRWRRTCISRGSRDAGLAGLAPLRVEVAVGGMDGGGVLGGRASIDGGEQRGRRVGDLRRDNLSINRTVHQNNLWTPTVGS
jgi:hypothetical protein